MSWKDAPTLETLVRDEYGKGNDAGFNWRDLPGIAADKASQVGSAISNMVSGTPQPQPPEMPKTTSTQTLMGANPAQWWELIPELMMNPQLLVNPQGSESSIMPVGAYTKNKRAALVSMGSEYDDVSRGLKDLYARATGDEAARQQYAQESAQKRGLLESLRSDYPGSTFVGSVGAYAPIPVGASSGAVGGLMTKVGMEKAGPAVANSLLADSAFTGAGIGAVNYEDDALWGGLMGAAGYKTMQTIGRLFSKPPNFNSKSANEIIDKANAEDKGLISSNKMCVLRLTERIKSTFKVFKSSSRVK